MELAIPPVSRFHNRRVVEEQVFRMPQLLALGLSSIQT